MIRARFSALLIATGALFPSRLEAEPITFAFVENRTALVAAHLTLDGPSPYTYEDVSSLTFTDYGAAMLTERVIQAAPVLGDYGYKVPPGPFSGEITDDPNGAAVLDATGTGLIGMNGQFATVFGDAPVPRLFVGATLRLNFGAPNSPVLSVDEIRIIPSGFNGGAVQGEWRLVPEPSSIHILAACIVAICYRRPMRHTAA